MRATTGIWHQPATALALASLAFAAVPAAAEQLDPNEHWADVEYTLLTAFREGQRVFVGVGREIDGVVNPTLSAEPGDVVQLILINGEGADHEFAVGSLDATTGRLTGEGSAVAIAFRVREPGTYEYFCTDHGHRGAGMEGMLVVNAPGTANPDSRKIVPGN